MGTAEAKRPDLLVFHDGNAAIPRDVLPELVQPQRGGDFGERLRNAVGVAFGLGYHRVVVIGTDVPGLRRRHIEMAFNSLADHDLVIGPDSAGGCYLIGVRRAGVASLSTITWNQDTDQAALEHAGAAVLDEVLADIDAPMDALGVARDLAGALWAPLGRLSRWALLGHTSRDRAGDDPRPAGRSSPRAALPRGPPMRLIAA